MALKYFALLTNVGAAKISNMAALGEKLAITSLAVGDGGGMTPTPNPAQTKLINEVRRKPLNSLSIDEDNDSQIIAEQIIPESDGGWWIREIGLFDADGDLVAIANCPESYKAKTEEGSGRTQVIRMLLTVSSTEAVTLKVDPSVVLATRKYVDDKIIEVKAYADDAVADHEAKANPHNQYLLIANALKEIADAGLVADVLQNLRLGEGSALPVGVPIPWPSATPPAEWLKCNGAAFDKLKYPKLATAYPSGNLPDLRGEFIRGVDDGRGVDSGRAILSWQSALSHDHRHYLPTTSGGGGDGTMTAVFTDNTNAISYFPEGYDTYNQNPSSGTTLQTYTAKTYSGNFGNESRPRNVAFNYIVRAA